MAITTGITHDRHRFTKTSYGWIVGYAPEFRWRSSLSECLFRFPYVWRHTAIAHIFGASFMPQVWKCWLYDCAARRSIPITVCHEGSSETRHASSCACHGIHILLTRAWSPNCPLLAVLTVASSNYPHPSLTGFHRVSLGQLSTVDRDRLTFVIESRPEPCRESFTEFVDRPLWNHIPGDRYWARQILCCLGTMHLTSLFRTAHSSIVGMSGEFVGQFVLMSTFSLSHSRASREECTGAPSCWKI
jgi:hypothetical protein